MLGNAWCVTVGKCKYDATFVRTNFTRNPSSSAGVFEHGSECYRLIGKPLIMQPSMPRYILSQATTIERKIVCEVCPSGVRPIGIAEGREYAILIGWTARSQPIY